MIAIKGGTVVDAAGQRSADVLIDDGRIAAVGTDLDAPSDAQVLDATGCLVAPGLVDLHTHLRQPGREEAETIESGSRAAALGGYTCVLAMPNTEPAIDNAGNVESPNALAVQIDKTGPVVTFLGNAGRYTVDQTVSIACDAIDPAAANGALTSSVTMR